MMTLTSMAGIQLADAENNNNASIIQLQSMSGAMPTATVEELNVPVFIDEYLQDSVDITTPPAFFKDLSNENNSNNVDGSAKYNGIDQEEYDQESLNEMVKYINTIMNNNNGDDNNNDNNNNTSGICSETFADVDEMYDGMHFLPASSNEDSEMMSLFNDSNGELTNFEVTEEAVDINLYDGVSLELADCLTYSQEITPLLSESIMLSTANENNSQIITTAEPYLPNYETDEEECFKYNTNAMCANTIGSEELETHMFCDDFEYSNLCKLKRKPKLSLLNTELANNNKQTVGDITTATIINDFAPFNPNDPKKLTDIPKIVQYLTSGGKGISIDTIKVEYDNDETSNQTHLTHNSSFNISVLNSVTSSSPNSPAPSTTSTVVGNTNINRRKRGRPPKDHSDRPDPTQLQLLSADERKRIEDRAKNNEASRQSRLKKKKEMESDLMEETELDLINEKLQNQLNKLKKVEDFLKTEVRAMVKETLR